MKMKARSFFMKQKTQNLGVAVISVIKLSLATAFKGTQSMIVQGNKSSIQTMLTTGFHQSLTILIKTTKSIHNSQKNRPSLWLLQSQSQGKSRMQSQQLDQHRSNKSSKEKNLQN